MYDVIAIGTATRDVFLESPLFKVLKDKAHLERIGFATGEATCFALGSKMDIPAITFATGGGATNAATTFARARLRTAAIMELGEDSAGYDVIEELESNHAKAIPVSVRSATTAYSTILLSKGGERTILSYRDVRHNLTSENMPWNKIKSRWVYLVPGIMDREVVRKLFEICADRNIKIAINPSKHFLQWGLRTTKHFLEQVNLVIMNREEAAYFTEEKYDNEKQILHKLHEHVSGVVVMTDGSNGAVVSDGAHVLRAGIFKEQKLVDRTGAGDAFGSGFLTGLLLKDEECEGGRCNISALSYAVRYASANATSVVEYVGAKAGILTTAQFTKDARWHDFPIWIAERKAI